MKPEEIKEIRGKLRQQTFCDELNKIAKTILPDASTINIRSLRNWETENKTNHRDPPEWIRFLIMQYKSKDLKHADICPDCGKGEIKENLCFKCSREDCQDRVFIDHPDFGVRVCAMKTEKQPEEEVLKLCPFCGSEDISAGAFSFSADCYISCENCGGGIEIEVPWDNMTEKDHDAVCFKALKKAWNTRTGETK